MKKVFTHILIPKNQFDFCHGLAECTRSCSSVFWFTPRLGAGSTSSGATTADKASYLPYYKGE